MKINDVITVLQNEFKSSDIKEINTQLKKVAEKGPRFKFTGSGMGHYGFTGAIKMITNDGLKVFDVNKVKLIRFEEFDKLELALKQDVKKSKPVTQKNEIQEEIVKANSKNKFSATSTNNPAATNSDSDLDLSSNDYDDDWGDEDDEDYDSEEYYVEEELEEIAAVKKKKSAKVSSGSKFIPKKK